MAFTPITAPEATQFATGRLVASSQLTDVAEGGTALALCTILGQERASIDRAIQGRLDAKFLDVSGPDLDAACAQLPNGGVARLGAAAASGACMVLTRTDTSGTLVVPANTVLGRGDNPSLRYVTTVSVTFLAGESTKGSLAAGYIPVVCTTLGTGGNCLAGTINQIVDGPEGLTSVSQAVALGGGVTRETDDKYRLRATLYLQAFMGSNTRKALEYVALTFQSQSGVRARNAATYFDPSTLPGYVELVVDDGTQFAGQYITGQTVTGTISNAQRRVYTQGPVRDDDLTTAQVSINGGTPSSVQWTLVAEAGELWFDSSAVTNGDTYEVTDYTVFTGFVAELQAVLFGASTNALAGLGWIAAGCRVRVVPPTPNLVRFSLNLVLRDGADFATVSAQVEAVLTEYCASLGPGVEFLIMDAYAALRTNVPNLADCTFNATNTSGQVCVSANVNPTSARASIRLLSFEAV